MPDVFATAKRSEVMSRIGWRGNKHTELALMKLLRAARITGWRRQVRLRIEGRSTSPRPSPQREEGVRVRPDLMFRKERVNIFVAGCFWHGCPKHSNMLPSAGILSSFKRCSGMGHPPRLGSASSIQVHLLVVVVSNARFRIDWALSPEMAAILETTKALGAQPPTVPATTHW